MGTAPSLTERDSSPELLFTESVVNEVAGIRKMVDAYVQNETPVPNRIGKNDSSDASRALVQRYSAFQTKINQQLVKEDRSDSRVHDAFKGFVDQSLSAATRVNVQELRNAYPNMADDVMGILDNVKSLKTRTTFYEYKYMHLNMFLIGFVESTQGVLKSFAEDMSKLNRSKDTKHSEIMSELVSSMKSMLLEDPSKTDIGAFESIIRGVQSNLKAVEDQFQQQSRGLETTALSALHSATQPPESSRQPPRSSYRSGP